MDDRRLEVVGTDGGAVVAAFDFEQWTIRGCLADILDWAQSCGVVVAAGTYPVAAVRTENEVAEEEELAVDDHSGTADDAHNRTDHYGFYTDLLHPANVPWGRSHAVYHHHGDIHCRDDHDSQDHDYCSYHDHFFGRLVQAFPVSRGKFELLLETSIEEHKKTALTISPPLRSLVRSPRIYLFKIPIK